MMQQALLMLVTSTLAFAQRPLPKDFNCTHSFEAECQDGPDRPAWNKNLTCDQCIRKIYEDIKKDDPEIDCEEAAEKFAKEDCKASSRSFNCSHSFEAECGTNPLPPWNKGLTCEECVKKTDEEIKKREPGTNCDAEAKVFLKRGCKASGTSINCTHTFEAECGEPRPHWSANLTCDQCLRKTEADIKQRAGKRAAYACGKEARVFERLQCKPNLPPSPSPSVCHASEYCCPDAKHCLTPTRKSCKASTSACTDGEVCCPLTKLCVKVGAPCAPSCPESSYCCPEARKCLSPVDPGTLCDPSKGAKACDGEKEVCCPLTRECVSVGKACALPLRPSWV